MEKLIFNDENIAKYFAGELDDKKLEMMENQMINDNNQKKYMKDFSHLWEKSAELGKFDNLDVETDWKKVKQRMGFKPKTKKIPFKTFFLRIAAILVLAFGLAYFLNQIVHRYPQVPTKDYFTVTAPNKLKDIVLPDNSVITLNKDATLIYNNNFGTDNRDVILEGEAFFEVTKNKDLPFRVFAGNSTIEVLGTSFNVNLRKDIIRVSVINGHVAFYQTEKKHNRIDLLKDEESAYNNQRGNFEKKRKLNVNAIAWKTGKFVFNGEPIDETLQIVAEYYNLELVNNLTHAVDEPMGSVSADSISKVLKYINMTVKRPFNYTIENNKLIVSD